MRITTTVALFLLCLNSYGQIGLARNWVDSETKYEDSSANLIEFTNSLPRGGGVTYYNVKRFSYVIFWTRIRNKSTTPIEINLNFSDLIILNHIKSEIKIILPKETMTIEKIQLMDYGLSNLQSLLNENFNQASTFIKKINPQEEYYFYFPVFLHNNNWPARASLILKGTELSYKITLGSATEIIPCGSLVVNRN